jgi:hypothetical protein
MSYTGSAISANPIAQQEIHLLNEGLSYHAVAAITGTRVATLKERNRLAYHVDIYAAFRKRIERDGIPNRLSVSDDFGHYFAGFFDGEGTIVLWHRCRKRPKPYPEYRLALQIVLRQDDLQVLEYIHDNIGGLIHLQKARQNSSTNPSAKWILENIKDLAEVAIPLFDKYRLHSKKRREYQIWRPLVVQRYLSTLGGETSRGGPLGIAFDNDFIAAADTVKALRKYTHRV